MCVHLDLNSTFILMKARWKFSNPNHNLYLVKALEFEEGVVGLGVCIFFVGFFLISCGEF